MNSTSDQQRRIAARRRLELYRDNSESALREEVGRIFKSPVVRRKVEPFLRLACSSALYRRVVDEVAKHTYNPPPTRRVSNQRDAVAWSQMEREVRYDRRLDLAARLCKAQNTIAALPLYSQRTGKVVLHILTQDQMTVIPHPDDPTRPLALIYDHRAPGPHGRMEVQHIYLDDVVSFRFNRQYEVDPASVRENEDGFFPAEFCHIKERQGDEFFDGDTGRDLESAHLAVALLSALRLRLHKSQGERVLKAEGNTSGMKRGQVIDAEELLTAPEGVTLGTLDLNTSAAHYIESIQDLVSTTAANHGLSRERINSTSSSDSSSRASDHALFEQRAEMITVFAEFERRLFELMRKVSRFYEDPARRISDEARLEVDFREMESRVSKKEQIEIWDMKEARGLVNFAQIVMAENPEMRTEEEAVERFERNLEMRARRIELERRLNTSGEPGNPGPSPQENGALGPQQHQDDGGLPPGSGVRGADQGNAPRRGEGI